MKALVFSRSPTRYAATRTLSVVSSRFNASVSPLDFTTNFELPNRNLPYQQCKVLLSGICGSDISMLDSSSSRYFEDFTSFPFVPGHEIVALAPMTMGLKGEW
ncbi:alcohol dehydrogenase catalytic domain-containing protein [Acidithrix sp. C25]|uniref:alcohol dehydrogenase catalytic domain-containing protein n=1 Tax=Acidithrix sp. C25 TaxID=1671482 RepID=UPI00191BB988|nr:alcohol dehydrogenase catalytic domain-containing protein [Acidithrix sp. C25]